MSDLRGIVTRSDGGVTTINPSDICLEILRHGGGISNAFQWRMGMRDFLSQRYPASTLVKWWWADAVPMDVALDWEVEKFVRDVKWRPDRPDREALARRWIMALHTGGLQKREAVALILEKDAPPYSVAHDIVHAWELPQDRTYRDAWRRSSNGGPVWVDENAAVTIDESRMWERYETHGARTA
jgi:hypothetical protein